jgi:serine/threonine protein kinase/Tol biopolymer transport system component
LIGMTLPPGTLFGPYKVAALIGAGGMGEVYSGTDTRLKRDVAIKVLPPLFASDTDRLARFQREAEVLASLNHTNIAHVYGLEQSDGRTALAMELVEGETLAERIARGPLAVDDALAIARQIADALEAAHARGIVHRDLKPGNVKLTPDGTVKVLDFGIAKALDARRTGAPLTTSATQTGLVLGTPAYMSPEQARGQSVDERADIWAFGCVLFEMLAGNQPFASDDVTLTPASLRASGAAVDALTKVPPAVRRTIKLCLESDVRKRIRHIGDVRLVLDGAFESSAPAPVAASKGGRRDSLTAYAVGALVLIALAVPALRHLRETPPPETRVDIVTRPTADPTSFALSPDGRQIVFTASGPNGPQLWLRSLATATAMPLAGTEGAVSPFWSPNSRAIGFFAEGSLKRLDLSGGVPQVLASADNGSGGTWNRDDVIVFAPNLTNALMQISANGGAATPVSALGPRQFGYNNPTFLPDGRRFLYTATGTAEASGIYIGALGSSVSTRLTPADSDALYLSSGWLLWVRGGTLVTQRLDLGGPALTGRQLTLADGVALDFRLRSGISVASTGLIAYRAGGGSRRQLTWFDRSGSRQGTLGEPDTFSLSVPRLTPDGRRAVVGRTVDGNFDLWLLDGSRTTRITFDPARDDYEQLSPDGNVVVFRSFRTGLGDLYTKLLGRTDPEQLLLQSDEIKAPTSWSSDGRFLIYQSNNQNTNADLWVLPMQGDHTPYVFLQTPFREAYGVFSPDGRWVAYYSNESGRPEVYLRPFFEPGKRDAATANDQWQISTDGGTYAAWRPDGRELYYLDPSGAMMAASITVTGNKLVPGTPQMLFRTRISRGGRDLQQGRQYDVTADGRFLINTDLDDDAPTPITLIQNWSPDTKE